MATSLKGKQTKKKRKKRKEEETPNGYSGVATPWQRRDNGGRKLGRKTVAATLCGNIDGAINDAP
jgi:hypothetical protein